MTQEIRALFNPASIAMVGATDKSGWSVNTHANLRRYGFGGPVRLVNPRTEIVHDERAYRTRATCPSRRTSSTSWCRQSCSTCSKRARGSTFATRWCRPRASARPTDRRAQDRHVRGTEPADLDAVADVVARVGALAGSLGDEPESLEINPLLVRGSRIEALDALVTWRTWARCEADTPNQRR